ncbi:MULTISPECIES: TetR/AcrR family transcriptional regulator [Rhodococcus]|jgi:AcrR family transcriptional regulator|uniref:TetR/AcrR family transcriptional regulator n=1 Tax=Rhodococcus aetherivorans TaxID=191292 RepID=A0A059MKM2_9NOCA|nr:MULTISPECIES: TetR/AcrR family transcriptional regulator [Rhodococcus]ETT27076.1 transcriptional regulator, TetR family [Rhodococcus rhodochrous ATCC 21198]ANZ23877.1 TetR family transcriptional regulator [Rhodococcus sp. WB1]KDE11648.1 TetR family transcriptional regulator [Rhodococcus aetherivorans]MDV6293964.1 helix-turn-helix domain-containing protein [Rhodococcus aetherivorans]NGP28364.1 TetR/AcrR family transcriptional regulator [Rhodococcus aetherivorans]
MARRRNGSVLSEDAEEARAQILEATETAFQRYGVVKTTMDDVAKEAGVSRPTIYRYFRDRDTLIAAVIEVRSRRLFDQARAYLRKRKTFAEQVVDGLIFLVDRGRKDPIIRLIVSPEHMDMATALLGSSGLAKRLTHEMWAPLMDEARERGEVREGVSDDEIAEWITLVELILVGRMDFDQGDDADHRRLLTKFMLPGIVTDTSAADARLN